MKSGRFCFGNIWLMKGMKAVLNLFLCLGSGLLPAVFALGMWCIIGELQLNLLFGPHSSLHTHWDVIPTVCNLLLKISPFAAFVFIKRRNWLALLSCGCAAAVAFGLQYFSWPPGMYPTLSHLVTAVAILNSIAFFASIYHEGMGRGDEQHVQQLGCGKHGTQVEPLVSDLTEEAEDSGATITISDHVEQVHT